MPVPAPSQSLGAPLAAFMGLSAPPARPAPPFTLTDQAGQPLSVPAHPPTVVVLTFFDAPCNDICPVLASEIEQADADLGAAAGHVEFLTVNSDPSALAASAAAPAEGTGLDGLANWRMLTGPLAALNAVWKAYGVSISLDPKTGQEAHNDVMDFIDQQRRAAVPGRPRGRPERDVGRSASPPLRCRAGPRASPSTQRSWSGNDAGGAGPRE